MKRVLFPFICYSALLLANPKDGVVVSGEATIQALHENVLEVRTGKRAIINWKEFSIAPGETTRFVQPGVDSAVLSRITGGKLSEIQGMLEANGRVYLVNPQGIIIAKDAVINAAGFIASTLDLLDEDFISGGELRFKGSSLAPLINYGTVKGYEGDVLLLGRFVRNDGKISAPQGMSGLAAAQEIIVRPEGVERIFIVPQMGESGEVGLENSGQIEALQAELKADGNAYKLAINQSGRVDARNLMEKDGRVLLIAEGGRVQMEGSVSAHEVDILGKEIGLLGEAVVEAHGGKVRVESTGLTVVDKKVRIDVSADGDAGSAFIWADKLCQFFGTVKADSKEGDGGFVEVSSPLGLHFYGDVNTLAPKGKPGTLLLDPTDVAIQTNGGTDQNAFLNGQNYMFTAPTAIIDNNHLANLLNTTTSVVISTSNTTANFPSQGLISVNDPVVWNSASSLTLQADSTITIIKDIISNGVGGISISSLTDIFFGTTSAPVQVTTNTGPLTLAALGDITLTVIPLPVRVGSFFGSTSTTAGGSLTLQGGSDICQFITASGGSNTFTIGKDVNVLGGSFPTGITQIGSIQPNTNSNIHFAFVGGDVNVIGGDVFAQIGHFASAAVTTTMAGDILFDRIGGDVNVIAGSGAIAGLAQIGHFASQASASFTASGNIALSEVNGDISLIGSDVGFTGSAIIGHGNEFPTSSAQFYSGSITIHQNRQPGLSDPAILLQPGTALDAHAVIGFEFQSFLNSTVRSSGISITSNGPIELQGSNAATHAVIGYYDPLNTTVADVKIDLIDVTTSKDLLLTPGNVGLGGDGAAFIGTSRVLSTGPAHSDVNIVAQNVILNGAPSGSVGLAEIANSAIGDSNRRTVNILAHGNIEVGVTGAVPDSAILYSSGPLTAIADVDIELGPNSFVENGNFALDLVVDNAFPKSPALGPGSFIIDAGADLNSPGPLQIFTSRRSQNQINAPLNGVTFVPGPYLLDTPTEQWGTYFPSSFGGAPFTIFYKDQIPSFLPELSPAFVEFFDLVKTYNNFIYTLRCFKIGKDNYPVYLREERTYNTKYADTLD